MSIVLPDISCNEPLLGALLPAALSLHQFTDLGPNMVFVNAYALLPREFADNLLQLIFFFFGPFTCVRCKLCARL